MESKYFGKKTTQRLDDCWILKTHRLVETGDSARL